MIYNLPELDRMSRALSRLETALLTKRTVSSASQNTLSHQKHGISSPLDMAKENQMLRLQCEEMRGQLQQAHLLLAEILGHGKNVLESPNASANKIRLNDLSNNPLNRDTDEEYNG